ncbi:MULTISPECIES: HNH endonuclease [unclassified Microbacterium]|uniref:HNH endonuclease n=1 Tax=unclassified Microbacterium TaxID=2609290 RepID=UPI00301026E2
MTKPTNATRQACYFRDGYRCVMCGAVDGLTFQHRIAEGMGGSTNIPAPVDGLTLCALCNAACEAELQMQALANGWKVRRWVGSAARVPVYFPHEFAWFRLEGTNRVRISHAVAMEMGCAVYGDDWMKWRARELFS